MEHIAIMKKEWNLTPKIIDGKKTVEARWYKSKVAPWNKIKSGETIYFKDSGSFVTVKAAVTKVEQYEIKNNAQATGLMKKYALEDLGAAKLSNFIKNYIKDKKYAIFIYFDKVEKITPFDIDKTGFGMQCAWIVVNSVKIKTK